jgi:glycolate oxidase FAD binding subunit
MSIPLKDIVERIKTAASAGTALRIRGGGSKDFYGQSLQGEILDTTALNGITSYEPQRTGRHRASGHICSGIGSGIG